MTVFVDYILPHRYICMQVIANCTRVNSFTGVNGYGTPW